MVSYVQKSVTTFSELYEIAFLMMLTSQEV